MWGRCLLLHGTCNTLILWGVPARARLVAVGRRVLSRGKGNIWCFWKCLQPFSCFAAGTLLVFFLDALMDLQSNRRKNNRSIICPLEITSTGERTTAIPSQVFASRAAWHKPSRMSLRISCEKSIVIPFVRLTSEKQRQTTKATPTTKSQVQRAISLLKMIVSYNDKMKNLLKSFAQNQHCFAADTVFPWFLLQQLLCGRPGI